MTTMTDDNRKRIPVKKMFIDAERALEHWGQERRIYDGIDAEVRSSLSAWDNLKSTAPASSKPETNKARRSRRKNRKGKPPGPTLYECWHKDCKTLTSKNYCEKHSPRKRKPRLICPSCKNRFPKGLTTECKKCGWVEDDNFYLTFPPVVTESKSGAKKTAPLTRLAAIIDQIVTPLRDGPRIRLFIIAQKKYIFCESEKSISEFLGITERQTGELEKLLFAYISGQLEARFYEQTLAIG